MSSYTQNLNLFKYDTQNDGDQVFSIDTALNDNWDKIDSGFSVFFENLFPIGSIYLSVTATCPLEGILGHWELIVAGKALWTGNGSNADTTIAAGLPNITGNNVLLIYNEDFNRGTQSGGALYTTVYKGNTYDWSAGFDGDGEYDGHWLNLNASRSSSIYGKSSTVQPPAYVVNVWKRIS